MNTRQPANFALNLNGHCTLPGGGIYVFSVGAATDTGSAYANWGIIYVKLPGVM